MTRTEILAKADSCVNGKREEDYGTPEDSFMIIADLWNAYLDSPAVSISALDVAMMMALLKVARIRTAPGMPTDDCFVDLAGYAACAGEIAGKAAIEA